MALQAGPGFGPALERAGVDRATRLDGLLAAAAGSLLLRAAVLGTPARLRWGLQVRQASLALAGLSEPALDEHLAQALAALRRHGPRGAALRDALALAAEASTRTLGLRPHATQLLAARELVRGRIVEMATGEGKSLTAALAGAVVAASGLPVHIFTVNAYLAGRDAQVLQPLYARLGLSVAAVVGTDAQQRAAAYRADVAYGVNQEVVFDYLRQRQGGSASPFAGRGLFFAIVDEADSILIDEARTPLILARERPAAPAVPLAALLALAGGLAEPLHCSVLPRERRVRLEPAGRERLAAWARSGAAGSPAAPLPVLQDLLEQALAALRLYERDRDYVVLDGKVCIVDEYTGRVLADRSWQAGLHQCIEIKEGLASTHERQTLARLTYPQFFRRYLRMAGMSGTVAEAAGELRRNYGAQVLRVPTHRPVQRTVHALRVFGRAPARWAAVVQAVLQERQAGRAVLVGTRSVRASEAVSAQLAAAGVVHTVLNARQDAAEADIVARAGEPGRVTVATNMAGRGTDIAIAPAVRDAGGLVVILTEFHDARRIDRQLLGRCARQGDPGVAWCLASLDDELFQRELPTSLLAALQRRWAAGQPLPVPLARLLLALAQRRAGARHRAERELTLAQDDALRDQLEMSTAAP
jgi:preprotein translocase subunit SecA